MAETIKIRFKIERFNEDRTLGLSGLKSFLFENLGKCPASLQFETDTPSEFDADGYLSVDAGAGASHQDGNWNVKFYPFQIFRDAENNIIYPEGYSIDDLNDGDDETTAEFFKFRTGDRYVKLSYSVIV